jgi:hypothetical protein
MREIVACLINNVLITSDPALLVDAVCRGENVQLLERQQTLAMDNDGQDLRMFFANLPTMFYLTDDGCPYWPIDVEHVQSPQA